MLLGLWTVVAQAITLSPTDDTYVQQASPTSAAGGTATALLVGFTPSGNTTRENITYVNFEPVTDLLTGATITHAVLRFFVNSVTTGGTIDIFKVTAGAWNEKTLTWNTQPTLASPPANSVLLSAGTAGSYVNVDITSVVRGWLSNSGTSLGLALRARVNSGTRLSLDSKETTATSHPMTLEVAVAGPAGPQGQPGPVGITFRTAWNGSTEYFPGDVVTSAGATWISVTHHTVNTAPASDATNWALLAAKGDAGPPGPANRICLLALPILLLG